MNRHIVLPVLLLAVFSSGCVTAVTTDTVLEYPVTGTVTAGPTCPVGDRALPPGCDDEPVGGAYLLILDQSGGTFGEVVADSDGEFSLNLPAGRYTLVPQPMEGLMGTAPPQDFDAGPGLSANLAVGYDTGIR
jgi:hypothetical protein